MGAVDQSTHYPSKDGAATQVPTTTGPRLRSVEHSITWLRVARAQFSVLEGLEVLTLKTSLRREGSGPTSLYSGTGPLSVSNRGTICSIVDIEASLARDLFCILGLDGEQRWYTDRATKPRPWKTVDLFHWAAAYISEPHDECVVHYLECTVSGLRTVPRTNRLARPLASWLSNGANQLALQLAKLASELPPSLVEEVLCVLRAAQQVTSFVSPEVQRELQAELDQIERQFGKSNRIAAPHQLRNSTLAHLNSDLDGEVTLLLVKEHLDHGSIAFRDRIFLYQRLRDVGRACVHNHQYHEGLGYFSRALSLFRGLSDDNSPILSDCALGIGACLAGCGTYDQAISWCEVALTTARAQHDATFEARTLTNMATIEIARGNRHGGSQLLDEAIRVLEAAGPESSYEIANLLVMKGQLEMEQGNLAAAIPLLERGHALLDGIEPRLASLASLAARLAEFRSDGSGDSLARLRDAVWMLSQERGWRSPDFYYAAINLADALIALGRSDQAIGYLRCALRGQLLRCMGKSVCVEELWQSSWDGALRPLVRLLMELGRVHEAVDALCMTTGLGLMRLVEEHAMSLDDSYREARQAWVEARSRLDDALAASDFLWNEQCRAVLWDECRALASMRSAIPTRIEVPEPNVDDIAGSLGLNEVFVGFFYDDEGTVAFLVRPGGVRAEVVGRDALPLLESLESDPWLVGTREGDLSRTLFDALFPEGPVREAVLASDSLVLCPDGPLWRVPFAALAYEVDGTVARLGLEKRISFVQAPGQLLRRSEPGDGPALVAGINEFGGPPTKTEGERGALLQGGLGNLGHAEDEAATVASRLAVEALVGPKATREEVASRMGSARIVHLATHGVFDDARPMSSGLVLKPDSDEGLLQAWHVLGMRLSADLVTLSACETARGRSVGGGGLVGTTYAFQAAGASHVLASLWRVDDASTAAFMDAFYAHRAHDGRGKAESLRLAMRELADAGLSPRHWAAFELFGRPDGTS